MSDGAKMRVAAPARSELVFRVNLREGGETRSALALNLSEGGLYLASDEPPPAGSTVSLELRLPTDSGPVAIAGRVVWTATGSLDDGKPGGMGIEFLNLDDRTREGIRTLIRRHGATTAHRAPGGTERRRTTRSRPSRRRGR